MTGQFEGVTLALPGRRRLGGKGLKHEGQMITFSK